MNGHLRTILIIFFIALTIRICFLLTFPEIGQGRVTFQYDTIAWNVAQGHGYSMDKDPPYTLTAYRPPVYPLLLSSVYFFFDHNYIAAKFLQAIIGAMICVIIYLIAFEVFNYQTGIIAALVSTVYPAFLFYTSVLIMEITLVFFVSLSIYLFIKVLKGGSLFYQVLFGVALGITSLCRPIMLLFPFAALLVFYFIFQNKMIAFKRFLVTFLMMILTITPWTIRNYIVFNEFVPIVTKGTGEQLWLGIHAAMESPYDLEGKLFTSVKAERDSIITGLTHVEAEKKMQELALKEIARDPLAYISKFFFKAGKLWFHPIGATQTLPQYSQILTGLVIIAYYLMFFLALWGIWIARLKPKAFFSLLTPIVYFTILHSLLYVINRYRIAALPFVIIFASFPLSNLITSFRKKFR